MRTVSQVTTYEEIGLVLRPSTLNVRDNYIAKLENWVNNYINIYFYRLLNINNYNYFNYFNIGIFLLLK